MAIKKKKSAKQKRRENKIRKIENHLKHYHQYKIAIKNIKLQLDSILPKMTASYELREGSVGAFVVKSSTENVAIDRIESRRALMLHEEMKQYETIINCIDTAFEGLNDKEKQFVELKYFNGYNTARLAAAMDYSEQHLFNIRHEVLNKLIHSLGGLDQF